MKCRKQFKYSKLEISNLWEVHLDNELWERIRIAAVYRRCTFSWITRYCVFRLARKRVLRMRFAMDFHSKCIKLRQKNAENCHRHIICLYGEDEKLLRITAMQLGISVSHMIRLSLYWFLPKIENLKVDWNLIFYHGTKICRYLDMSRKNFLKMPFVDSIFYTKWPIECWWRRPLRPIPIPYSPSDKINNIYRFLQPPQSENG